MLAVMTYSYELLFSAVGGLTIGHFIFYKQRFALSGNVFPPSSAANPCCDSVEDAAQTNQSTGNRFDYAPLNPTEGEPDDNLSTLYLRSNTPSAPNAPSTYG